MKKIHLFVFALALGFLGMLFASAAPAATETVATADMACSAEKASCPMAKEAACPMKDEATPEATASGSCCAEGAACCAEGAACCATKATAAVSAGSCCDEGAACCAPGAACCAEQKAAA